MVARRWIGMGLFLVALGCAGSAGATPAGNSFTYQGRLESGGIAANGSYDFIFDLYDVASGGSPIAAAQNLPGVAVNDGLFTVALDFGAGMFDGNARWLEIQVRAAGGGTYALLAPRQPVTPAPFSLFAMSGAGGSSQWLNSTYGIDYSAGNVGIGAAANGAAKLRVDMGTAAGNAAWVTSNNASYATLSIGNSAPGGYCIFDDKPLDKHYFAGSIGLGTLSPATRLHSVVANYDAIRGEVTPQSAVTGYNTGLYGIGHDGPGGVSAGVVGTAESWVGVVGRATTGRGVDGSASNSAGFGVVGGNSVSGDYGILGTSTEGIRGIAVNATHYAGNFTNTATGGISLHATAPVNGIAFKADGPAQVKTLQILGGADLAEPFDLTPDASGEAPDPGMVVSIDPAHPGLLCLSNRPYDSRVAGVISGANGLEPGVVLESEGQPHADGAHPVAMSGRVWCWVDATLGAVRPGDLLTTSGTPGLAMRAADRDRAPGAILGKAMTPLASGRGLVLVLVSLQ
jgi:hypothetical protein